MKIIQVTRPILEVQFQPNRLTSVVKHRNPKPQCSSLKMTLDPCFTSQRVPTCTQLAKKSLPSWTKLHWQWSGRFGGLATGWSRHVTFKWLRLREMRYKITSTDRPEFIHSFWWPTNGRAGNENTRSALIVSKGTPHARCVCAYLARCSKSLLWATRVRWLFLQELCSI